MLPLDCLDRCYVASEGLHRLAMDCTATVVRLGELAMVVGQKELVELALCEVAEALVEVEVALVQDRPMADEAPTEDGCLPASYEPLNA